jgi:hypothetical protein
MRILFFFRLRCAVFLLVSFAVVSGPDREYNAEWLDGGEQCNGMKWPWQILGIVGTFA